MLILSVKGFQGFADVGEDKLVSGPGENNRVYLLAGQYDIGQVAENQPNSPPGHFEKVWPVHDLRQNPGEFNVTD